MIGVPSTGASEGAAALIAHGVELWIYADEALTTLAEAYADDAGLVPITSVTISGSTLPAFYVPDTLSSVFLTVDGGSSFRALPVDLPELAEGYLDEARTVRDETVELTGVEPVVVALDADPDSTFRQQQDARQMATYGVGFDVIPYAGQRTGSVRPPRRPVARQRQAGWPVDPSFDWRTRLLRHERRDPRGHARPPPRMVTELGPPGCRALHHLHRTPRLSAVRMDAASGFYRHTLTRAAASR